MAAGVLLLGLVVRPPQAVADASVLVTQVKADVGFSAWPGKGGPLKKGYVFALGDHPALAGFIVDRDVLDDDDASLGIVRTVAMHRGSERLTVTLGVAHTSTDNGQELFLSSTLVWSDMAALARVKRGDLLGLGIGDLNFIPKGASVLDVQGSVAFVRNNVFCEIEDGRPGAPALLDVAALATAIDAQLLALPDLTPAGFDALRPVITTFTPAVGTLSASGGASTTLTVAVSDPAGETITRRFDGEGQVQLDTSGLPVTVRPTHVTGVLPVTLRAVNQSLQFGAAQTTLTVVP